MKKAFKFFDVTLRDGIQTSKKIYTLNEKKQLLHSIMNNYKPLHVEVGSLVSKKVLPQMNNSMELYNYAVEKYPKSNFYMLIPNIKYLKEGVNNGVNNFSFITSVSNEFQKKNTNMELYKAKNELNHMIRYVDKNCNKSIKKLYVSCINECPIAGKIENIRIVEELLYYKHNYSFDNICLSDTCGTLSYEDMVKIIEMTIRYGMSPNQLSIHLHLGNKDKEKLIKMIKFLSYIRINMFDVSTLENSGGCSVTIDEGKTRRNLTYDDLNM